MSIDRSIKMWYIYTIKYCSATEGNEIVPFAEMWMDLETVIQSEVSQKEKQIPYANTYIWNLKKTVLRNLVAGQE